ncbi:hypothetical protein [Streptomyces sp. NPDC055692]
MSTPEEPSREDAGRAEQSVHRHFVQGAAHKLGSGVVGLLILGWEKRR